MMCFRLFTIAIVALGLLACDKSSIGAAAPDTGVHLYVASGYINLRQVDYTIDNSLNLNIVKNVRLDTDLQIHDTTNLEKLTPLPSDKYRLRYALIRNGFEDAEQAYQVITGGEKTVDVVAGHLVTDIPLKVKDPRLLGSRNHMLIEVAPLTGNAFTPEIYEAALDASTTLRLSFAPFDMSVLKKPDVHNLGDLISLAKQQDEKDEQQQKLVRDNYAQIQNLIDWPASQTEYEGLSRQKLMDAMQTQQVDSSDYSNLCNLWRDKLIPGLLKDMFKVNETSDDPVDFAYLCNSSRDKGLSKYAFFRRLGDRYEPFFVFQKVYMVDQAGFGGLLPQGKNLQITIGDQFYVRSRFERNYDAGLRPLSLIPIIGPYLSLAGYLAVDVSLKQDSGDTLRFTSQMPLDVEDSSLKLNFSKYRQCLIVRMNPEVIGDANIQWFVQSAGGDVQRDQMRRALAERGLLVCGDQETQLISKTERYYYIYPSKTNGYEQDPTDIRNRSFSLALRGQRDFFAFMEAGKSKFNSPDSTGPDFAPNWLDGVPQVLNAVTPAAPGVYLDGLFY